jgi:hypothetical protein
MNGLTYYSSAPTAENLPPAAAPDTNDTEVRMAESAEKPGTSTSPTHQCEVCGAKVGELRRGRCWGCYTKWADGRPVGLGAACCMCNDRRREHLRMTELLRAWVPMCFNCAARAAQLAPMPQTLDEIRVRLDRERRRRDRRIGKQDTRVFQRERRGLERRRAGAAAGDDLMLVDDADILIVEASPELEGELGDEPVEETRILLPPAPPASR